MKRRQISAQPKKWKGKLSLVILCVCLILTAWLWSAGTLQKASESLNEKWAIVAKDEGFLLQGILLEGRQNLDKKAIYDTIGAKVGDPISNVNAQQIQNRLEALPWVKAAAIERRLPDHLIIRIQERKPIALWQHDGRMDLLGEEGVMIPVPSLQPYHSLPQIVGMGADVHAPNFLHMLQKYKTIFPHTISLVRVAKRRWNLHLKNQVVVRLPEKNVEESLEKLKGLIEKKRILNSKVEIIDFRLPDRFVVRYKTGKQKKKKR